MANSRSLQQSSDREGATSFPEGVFLGTENAAGFSGAADGESGEPLDPKGMLQLAAEWAASSTSAQGAAIAVGDASGMCCCASFGNAPVVGAPVSSSSGLSGICLRTSKLVQCDDTKTDPRVDADACRELDLRSVLIVPVLVDGSLKALIEVFSSRPHAFDASHKENLAKVADSLAALLAEHDSESLAGGSSTAERIIASTQVEGAANPADIPASPVSTSFGSAKATPVLKPFGAAAAADAHTAFAASQAGRAAKAKPAPSQAPPTPAVRWRAFSPAKKAGTIAVSLLFLLGVGWYLVGRDHSSGLEGVNAEASSSQQKTAPGAATPEITFDQSALSLAAPAEGPSPQGTAHNSQFTPGKLIRRVEPIYPPSARDSGVGGSVVLTAIVSKTGAVENVKVVRGPELLTDAATQAVQQWVYEPYRRSGEPVAVEITIVVKFTPPKRP